MGLELLAVAVPPGHQPGARWLPAHLLALPQAGEHTISEREELFSLTRLMVYGALERDRVRTGNVVTDPTDASRTRSAALLPEL